jgi:hypothetical protein
MSDTPQASSAVGSDGAERALSDGAREPHDGGTPPVFLERNTYRRRRITDAARLLPILGIGLFLIPLLWPASGNADLTEPVRTSGAITYIFIAWGVLIVASALLGGRMTDSSADRPSAEKDTG